MMSQILWRKLSSVGTSKQQFLDGPCCLRLEEVWRTTHVRRLPETEQEDRQRRIPTATTSRGPRLPLEIHHLLDPGSTEWILAGVGEPRGPCENSILPQTRIGLHEFNRMPFDLTGAPSSFTAGVVGRMSMSRPKYHLSPSAGREASMTGWTTSRGSHAEQVEGGREGSVVLIPPDGKMQTACKQLKPEVHNGTFDGLVQAVHQQFQLDRWHEGKRLGAGPILVMACVPWWLRNIWTWGLMGDNSSCIINSLPIYRILKSHLEGTRRSSCGRGSSSYIRAGIPPDAFWWAQWLRCR